MNKKKYNTISLVFWLIQDKKIEPEYLFNFAELFWPTFVKKDGYVFLKDKFSGIEYQRLLKRKYNPEYWLNLLTIDDFFSEKKDWKIKSTNFAKILVEIWHSKLCTEFPSKNFTFEFLHDEKSGDFGLTFYQKAMI